MMRPPRGRVAILLVLLSGVAAVAAHDAVRAQSPVGTPSALDAARRLAAEADVTPPDSGRPLLRGALWRGVERVQLLELRAVAAASADNGQRSLEAAGPVFEQRDEIGALLTAVLDTVVFETDWGSEELDDLRAAFPHSALLERYAARLAAVDGRPHDAVRLYDRLLRRTPTDVRLQRERAAVLDRTGQTREAMVAYTRTLELTPEDPEVFRALVRLHRAAGSLEQLLEQIRRLRLRLPESAVLADREIEVLHRLGRPDEAQSAARRLEPVSEL